MPLHSLSAVPGLEPVEGWTLWTGDDHDGDGFYAPYYVAFCGDERRSLNVSRFFFTPTQARFAWLVRHGFPHGVLGAGGGFGPLNDQLIDVAIAAEAATAKMAEIRERTNRQSNLAAALFAAPLLVGGALVLRGILAAPGVLS